MSMGIKDYSARYMVIRALPADTAPNNVWYPTGDTLVSSTKDSGLSIFVARDIDGNPIYSVGFDAFVDVGGVPEPGQNFTAGGGKSGRIYDVTFDTATTGIIRYGLTGVQFINNDACTVTETSSTFNINDSPGDEALTPVFNGRRAYIHRWSMSQESGAVARFMQYNHFTSSTSGQTTMVVGLNDTVGGELGFTERNGFRVIVPQTPAVALNIQIVYTADMGSGNF